MLSLLNSIRSYFKRKSLFFAFLMVVTSLNQSMAQADRMNATRQPLLVTSEISLKALAFGQTDEQTVLVVAKDTELDSRATILKSTDQGQTWRVKAVYNKQYLSNIAFLNPKLGVAVGIGGFALKTTDGGETWNKLVIPINSFAPLIKIQFLDQDRIRLLSKDGELFFTEDGGRTWKQHTFTRSGRREGEFYGWLTALSYRKENELWVLGERGQIYQSSDNGLTWKEYGESLAKLVKQKDYRTINFLEIRFFSARSGFMFAETEKELFLFKTEDGGETWQVIKTFTQTYFVRAQFLNSTTFWFQDAYNYCAYLTTDGGKTWKQMKFPSTEKGPVEPHPFFLNEKSGWLFPVLFHAIGTGLRTFDGGETWQKQSVQVLEK